MPWRFAFVAIFGSACVAYNPIHIDPIRLGLGGVDLAMTTWEFIPAPAEEVVSLLNVAFLASS
jgi:hypothetical protein